MNKCYTIFHIIISKIIILDILNEANTMMFIFFSKRTFCIVKVIRFLSLKQSC